MSNRLISVGQDAVFAKGYATRYGSVAEVLRALDNYVVGQLPHIGENLFRENSPLAASHKTRFPILQGPMTRVSDVPEFCDKVEQGGALPFLAVAVLQGSTLTTMLRETKALMGARSWGVGLLGFNEPELFREQMSAAEEAAPPFAILSGGRADQAFSLEEKGITTYLHAPSPSILSDYIRSGVRKFIFEGRECGGHVGPRTSFVLWSTMVETLLASGLSSNEFRDLKVVFAGGIHDALSTAMVSALALPLAQQGAQVGVLMGTAYIFTEEAVSSGAVTRKFQEVALESRYTRIADAGSGHAIRIAPTQYYDTFEREKSRLLEQGLNLKEIRKSLDESNLGRLRMASKGIKRVQGEHGSELASVDEAEQLREGIYMIGEVVSVMQEVFTIPDLHKRVTEGASAYLAERQPATGSGIVDAGNGKSSPGCQAS